MKKEEGKTGMGRNVAWRGGVGRGRMMDGEGFWGEYEI
jgi:hypothetical protein